MVQTRAEVAPRSRPQVTVLSYSKPGGVSHSVRPSLSPQPIVEHAVARPQRGMKGAKNDSYFLLCRKAIVELNGGRLGVGRNAIRAFVQSHRSRFSSKIFNATLRKSVGEGKLVQIKGSFKLPLSTRRRVSKKVEKTKAGSKLKRAHSYVLDSYVGRKVSKKFPLHGVFSGTVTACNRKQKYWRVAYEDGDAEDVNESELLAILCKKVGKKIAKNQKTSKKASANEQSSSSSSSGNAPPSAALPGASCSLDPHCGIFVKGTYAMWKARRLRSMPSLERFRLMTQQGHAPMPFYI